MAEVHHFSFGAFNPVAAFLMAFLGSLLGLLCTSRARRARTRGRRTRWLAIAAVAIGGGAIWLMHFMAMLGFEMPDSPVRYDPGLTMASLLLAVLAVGIGLGIVGHGRRSRGRILGGGLFTGIGVLAMHYTGMAALHVAGTISYQPLLVAASAVIAVVAATVALWFTVSVRGWAPIAGAAAIMAVAVCGMHYTGMAAMDVRLRTTADGAVEGISPFLLIVPITLLTAATLLGTAFSGLQAMTEEEFTGGVPRPPVNRGIHAETPWSLRSTAITGPARTGRPSPYPRTGPAPYPNKAGRQPYPRGVPHPKLGPRPPARVVPSGPAGPAPAGRFGTRL